MCAREAIVTNSRLTAELSLAITKALESGMTKDDIAAVLETIKTLLEGSDDE
jgi:hypothetical protein